MEGCRCVRMDVERKQMGVDGMLMDMEGYDRVKMSVWVCGYVWIDVVRCE